MRKKEIEGETEREREEKKTEACHVESGSDQVRRNMYPLHEESWQFVRGV